MLLNTKIISIKNYDTEYHRQFQLIQKDNGRVSNDTTSTRIGLYLQEACENKFVNIYQHHQLQNVPSRHATLPLFNCTYVQTNRCYDVIDKKFQMMFLVSTNICH